MQSYAIAIQKQHQDNAIGKKKVRRMQKKQHQDNRNQLGKKMVEVSGDPAIVALQKGKSLFWNLVLQKSEETSLLQLYSPPLYCNVLPGKCKIDFRNSCCFQDTFFPVT